MFLILLSISKMEVSYKAKMNKHQRAVVPKAEFHLQKVF